eukprot:CAMPEP_0119054262 /NCGR_PEP_ID=MMETSP1177-20130426/74961_1 /TAXON_ID=2985 /ORGANISM="Ochromonas sp, Strain CCMP1899" /LENGTH=167 /DNA_ID=CAMNT_0007034453 /DNA_START=375 /DNA_END=878 /DNA_ORIENTATION=+
MNEYNGSYQNEQGDRGNRSEYNDRGSVREQNSNPHSSNQQNSNHHSSNQQYNKQQLDPPNQEHGQHSQSRRSIQQQHEYEHEQQQQRSNQKQQYQQQQEQERQQQQQYKQQQNEQFLRASRKADPEPTPVRHLRSNPMTQQYVGAAAAPWANELTWDRALEENEEAS